VRAGGGRSAARRLSGRTIGIKLRYDDFKIVTRDQTVDEATCDALVIRRVAGLCLKRAPLDRHLRLLGVRVAKLEKAGMVPVPVAALGPHTEALF